MRILAVDTATEVCGAAFWEDGRVVSEICLAQGETHTRVLMKVIGAVLDESGRRFDEVDAFVVTQGPGSFTGLRIGISTVKGFAAATGKPLTGVSSLAVLAHQAPLDAPWICPVIDARRREVYWSAYRRRDGLVQVAPEKAGRATDIEIAGAQGACLFIGNGARLYADVLKQYWPRARLADPGQHALRPGVLARLGAQRLQGGSRNDLHRFTPVYLRKSDAELGAGIRKPDSLWTWTGEHPGRGVKSSDIGSR